MTTHAVTGAERRPPIPASSTAADGDALVPIRGGLLASAAVVAVNALALAVIGFTGSYRSVRDLALGWGWGWFSYVFPVGIDVGIIGLIAADLFLCAIRTPAPILRWFAWVLTVATVVFNASSGWPPDGSAGWMDYVEAAAHATMPGLVVVITEALRRAIARRARIADGRQFEPLGIARWVLAPLPTFGVWRRMRLWDVYTRAEALDLERDRLTLRDELREKYGRKWKQKARPVELRAMRDAGRGLPIPAQLIANAELFPANADRANTDRANAANTDRANATPLDGAANTVNAANGVEVPSVNAGPVGPAAANSHLTGMETVRTPGGPASEHPAFAVTDATPPIGADLRESHRERASVPAAAPARSVVRSTVPAPYSPAGPVANGDRELVGANAASLAANAFAYAGSSTVNGANGYREGAVGFAVGEGREHPGERYTEDRAGRRRLAEDFLRAKETEQPPPSQAKFAERIGVAPATVSKAMKEWREDHIT
ncbi:MULTISPECIES: DUF2637 domain-containing protein [unclassified Streptomyces]|uniref:DUF2637 domain-containing protein n=1 Tax=unclassified Streptomyces TaxID=2593676 RepID=UPI00074A7DE0|nr:MULTISPECIES: DUF2637 domain-containing protein [unclassified Streptomyces]KUL73946.1 hypothetical protein ADL34_18970 [Streptomyces sp. NRRL WC-3605]KUL74337.1 hypothetical protein ADL33_17720 [Streptomyces sp. NRRL WC-3604]